MGMINMIKTNVYLSEFTPDKMMVLLEILNYGNDYLKSHYYEVVFGMSGFKNNDIEIKSVKQIDDVLPYLDAVFKDKSIKENQLDDKSSKYIIRKLYDGLKRKEYNIEDSLKINKTKIEAPRHHEEKIMHIINDKNDIEENLHSEYINNKKYIKVYLDSKKGIK
jgi:hypothetical protein